MLCSPKIKKQFTEIQTHDDSKCPEIVGIIPEVPEL